MYPKQLFALALGALAVLTWPAAHADAVADALAGYAAQGAGPFDAAAGERRWNETFTEAATGKPVSCASCHRDEDCLECHSAEPQALRISPHPAGWRGSFRCRMLDRGNRRTCLRCHITEDELGCDWSK